MARWLVGKSAAKCLPLQPHKKESAFAETYSTQNGQDMLHLSYKNCAKQSAFALSTGNRSTKPQKTGLGPRNSNFFTTADQSCSRASCGSLRNILFKMNSSNRNAIFRYVLLLA